MASRLFGRVHLSRVANKQQVSKKSQSGDTDEDHSVPAGRHSYFLDAALRVHNQTREQSAEYRQENALEAPSKYEAGRTAASTENNCDIATGSAGQLRTQDREHDQQHPSVDEFLAQLMHSPEPISSRRHSLEVSSLNRDWSPMVAHTWSSSGSEDYATRGTHLSRAQSAGVDGDAQNVGIHLPDNASRASAGAADKDKGSVCSPTHHAALRGNRIPRRSGARTPMSPFHTREGYSTEAPNSDLTSPTFLPKPRALRVESSPLQSLDDCRKEAARLRQVVVIVVVGKLSALVWQLTLMQSDAAPRFTESQDWQARYHALKNIRDSEQKRWREMLEVQEKRHNELLRDTNYAHRDAIDELCTQLHEQMHINKMLRQRLMDNDAHSVGYRPFERAEPSCEYFASQLQRISLDTEAFTESTDAVLNSMGEKVANMQEIMSKSRARRYAHA
ncbi:hypothetical protein THASP1DRAFT_24140 [Thamnocephalis sphaerospora]|uniref:Uncharacterized protein n=1 Tax=Thamnocephalis sphaerospora TaxID=78915 RepID=A0A4P9XP43_9FUNG|nr:hypothetical protein THASP1DRAFT_24140 [Thamnocephalis sphaerospora]|eukprot:RKP07757.1 hypothetical protein THASP1DRAFT_24140 [Thamnocephalis sphaerospora]